MGVLVFGFRLVRLNLRPQPFDAFFLAPSSLTLGRCHRALGEWFPDH
jgi:hypothetical protein